MKLSRVLEAIKEELKKPLPEPRVVSAKKERKKMAKKAKKIEDDEDREDTEADEEEGDEEEEAPKAKKGKSKDKGKKAAKPKAKAKDEDDEGYVSIADLAEEAEIEAQSARVKLRDAEIDKPEGGRWRWKDGSKALKEVRKVLGL